MAHTNILLVDIKIKQMEMALFIIICMFFSFVIIVNSFNTDLALSTAFLCSIAYCNSTIYQTYNYTNTNDGLNYDFKYFSSFSDPKTGLRGILHIKCTIFFLIYYNICLL